MFRSAYETLTAASSMWLGEAAETTIGSAKVNITAILNPVFLFIVFPSPNARKHIQAFATPWQSLPEIGVLTSWMYSGELWLQGAMNDWLYAFREQSS